MRITPSMLKDARTCEAHYNTFVARWPEGVDVTQETCEQAHALGLDLDWAAANLFSEYKKAKYRALQGIHNTEFLEARSVLWRNYRQKHNDVLKSTKPQEVREARCREIEALYEASRYALLRECVAKGVAAFAKIAAEQEGVTE